MCDAGNMVDREKRAMRPSLHRTLATHWEWSKTGLKTRVPKGYVRNRELKLPAE